MNIRRIAALAALCVMSVAGNAAENFHSDGAWFEAYEATKFAFTSDDDDEGFLDAVISIKFPVRALANVLNKDKSEEQIRHDPFIAFTGRFGFYWFGDGRESSPVIGKRFNPVFGWRFLRLKDTGTVACPKSDIEKEQQNDEQPGKSPRAVQQFVPAPAMGNREQECAKVYRDSFLQLVYAHESNGQSIVTSEAYAAARLAAIDAGEDPDTANDAISRGWDYIGLTWKPRACLSWCESDRHQWSNYLNVRYFLDDGLLQGPPEEVNPWEPLAAQGKPRSEVNGIALASKLQFHTCMDDDGRACKRALGDVKLQIGFETGYDKAFKYNTFRAEAGVHLAGFPITFWWQRGYANDLAMYYKKGTSYGIGLDIGSF